MANEVARLGYVRRALRTLRKGKEATRNDLFAGMPQEEGDGNRSFTRKVMAKLVACGAIRKTGIPGLMESNVYVLGNIEALDAIVESDETISDFLWGPEKQLALGPPIPVAPPKAPEPPPRSYPPDPNIPLFKRPTNPTAPPQPERKKRHHGDGPPPPPGWATMPPPPTPPPTFQPPLPPPWAPPAGVPPAPMPSPGEPPPAQLDSIETTNKLLIELIETMHTSLQSTIYAREAVDEIRKEIKALDAKFNKLLEVWK